jgi:hypothetical protein
MKTLEKFLPVVLASALALLAAGCNHTISETKKSTVSSDGSVKTKETSVVQKPDGTTVKTEETKRTAPVRP